METLTVIAFGIAFFTLIMVSVALHEIGHMVPAKLFGVRVPRYFVGFGPTLWSTRRGDTEYGVKGFPLGGFVQLLGMYPPRPDGRRRRTRLADFADAARDAEWEDITPDDVENERLVYQKKTWQKLVGVAGGPAMNLLIAFFLLLGVTAGYGVVRPQTTIAYVQQCIITDASRTECSASDPKSPAAQAGLQVGDRIVSFNGTPISSYSQLSGLIRANLGGEARITVERDGKSVDLTPVHTVVSSVARTPDPGARLYAYARDFQQDNLIWVSEEWTSDAALTEHLATPHISEFLARISKLSLISMEARKYEVSHVGTVTPPPAA